MTAKLPSAEVIRELHRKCYLAEKGKKDYLMIEWIKIRAVIDALEKAERKLLAKEREGK